MNEPTLHDYKRRLEQVFGISMTGASLQQVKKREDGTYLGDFIPVNDWVNMAKNGGFVDYDGHGHFCFNRGNGVWIESTAPIRPSDISRLKLNTPDGFTHVLWFNR